MFHYLINFDFKLSLVLRYFECGQRRQFSLNYRGGPFDGTEKGPLDGTERSCLDGTTRFSKKIFTCIWVFIYKFGF